MFRKDGKFYLITSGTTDYFPNPSKVATADLIHGPWNVLGNPCIDDSNNDSFNCQFSSVFKVPGKELYMALGDRWMVQPWRLQPRVKRILLLQLMCGCRSNSMRICLFEWKEEWSPAEYPDEVQVDLMQEMIKNMRGAAASFMRRNEEPK
ncbi:hypothetical protein P40081_27575 [Paenibacillus sp. FSL P4-0081]|uniref:hypothetical protein n=1 Tax=unclassified Paenibacillus TaxID=185978 RepID=UPI0004F8C778|nr:hypothetical protein [Paenibacillus sp. FSL P4-0081]AIQ31498.1 hypothetical protein P40081_27575 [Paenibacillus sp. FSL P4-0081]